MITTYQGIEGLEKFNIKCVFEGTEREDNNFIHDMAEIFTKKMKGVETNDKRAEILL